MGEPVQCGRVSIRDFNIEGRARGVSVIDEPGHENGVADEGDTFVSVTSDGQSRILRFDHPAVQGTGMSVLAKCREVVGRSSRREQIQEHFGVRFGESMVRARCACEYVGVYDESGTHLFDIMRGGVERWVSEEHIISELERNLGIQWNTKLDVDFRAKTLMRRHGIELDEGRNEMINPRQPGARFILNGDPDHGGYNMNVHVSPHDENTLAIDYEEDDGNRAVGYLDLSSWTYTEQR